MLAAGFAVPDSPVVLATAGGSPDWLLGPLAPLGLPFADGPLAGPLFMAGLAAAVVLHAVVVARARFLPPRLVLGAVAGLHAVFLLAPPLLSQDVFSYLAYARLGEVHGLDPYEFAPQAIPGDPVFGFAGSKDAVSVYGPLFTLGTYALVPLGVPAGLWVIKAAAAAASLAVVAVVVATARRLERPPVAAAALVGLHPLVLVHVVGGAHNEAVVVLLTVAGIALWVAGRERSGIAAAAFTTGLKASGALVVPFLVLGARSKWRAAAAAAAAVAALAALGLAVFGPSALNAFAMLGANQERLSSFSGPARLAELLALALPGGAADWEGLSRALFALALAAVLAVLAWRTWRGGNAIQAAGWATFATMVCSGWLVPWYALWLLPLAALAGSRRLVVATLALCAYMSPIAIPL